MTAVQINLQTTIGPIRGSGEIVFTEPLQTTLSTGSQVSGQGKLSILTATNWNLAQILDEGVSGIVAAINNKQYTMNLSSNTAIFSDTRAVYAGTSAAAVAAGVYTPAVAMNALGLGMGANRPSDGLWVNTVFISASTGAATFSGQVASGSTVTGNLQVATSGAISSGQTAYNTGTGYWLEYNAGTPRLSVGSSTNGLTWNGSVLAVIGGTIDGTSTLETTAVSTVVSQAANALPTANFGTTLSAALAAGTNNIIAAASAGTYTAKMQGTYASFQDINAVLNGAGPTTAGNKLALGIDASGMIAGYNAATTGTWVTTLLMDTSAGNLTIGNGSNAMIWNSTADTLTLGSGSTSGVVIAGSGSATFAGSLSAATVTASGLTVNGAVAISTSGNLHSGQTAYNTGTGYWIEYNAGTPRLSVGSSTNGLTWNGSALAVTGGTIDGTSTINGVGATTLTSNAALGATAMQATVANVLTGSGAVEYGNLVYNTTTGAYTSGSGTVISSNGIASMTSATNGFAITSAGNAVFSGTISASTINGGTINGTSITAGSITSSTYIDVTGYIYATGTNLVGSSYYAISGIGSGGNNGVLGQTSSGAGVVGIASSGGWALYGNASGSGAVGVYASGLSGATALAVHNGPMTIDNQIQSSLATGTAPFSVASTTAVPNLNAQYWNGLTFNAPTTGAQTITLAANGPSSGARTIEWVPTVNASGTTTGWLAFIAA